jgi:hypothetical protein
MSLFNLTTCNYCHTYHRKLWDFVGGDIPDDFIINAIVNVNQAVTHSGNRPSLDLRKSVTQFVRNLLDGFTDYLDAPDEGAHERLVFKETLFSNAMHG